MKKTFKRLGAVLLAAFMLLSTTICALAAETPAGASTTSDTITLNVSNVSDSDTVSAYRLVEYNKDGNGYKFFDGDDTKKGFETYIKSQTDIGDKTAEKYLAGLDAAGVNKLLEGYAAECNKTSSEYTLPSNPITSKPATKNTATLENLKSGYYLLLTSTDTKNNRIYTPLSAFVKMDGENLVVYAGANNTPLKAESDKSYKVSAKAENGPTIDKKTNATKSSEDATWKETAAAGVNDIVRFYVEVNIPAYNNVSALNLTVNDTLTNLKYKEGSVRVYQNKPDPKGHNDSNIKIENAIKNSENVVEQNYTTSNGAGTQKLKFELDYQSIMGDAAAQSKTVYIYYEAIMQKEAVTGTNHQGENVATLKYSNAANPNIEYTTDPEDTDVFTYYMGLTKKKNKTDDSLKGAYFSVYTEKTSSEPLPFVKVTENDGTEYYRLAVESDAEKNKVTQIEADFQIRGLDANTYYLEEVVAPQGYTKPSGRFEITMTSQMENNKHTGTLDNTQSSIKALDDADTALILSSGVSTEKNYQFSISLGNFSTPNLPTTGGTGTVLLSIGGVVLMAAGAYLLFFRKKKEN